MKKNVLRERIKKNSGLTLFQKKILIAAMHIPRGKVRSYAWVAERAGFPNAARAAGQALARNSYAPQVPCHRVIASDGSIGGYSGGVMKKKRLLKKEGVECGW